MKIINKKEPLISIIVPVYNVEEYLYRCVESILEQTYKNIEIILVNDGSTDGSGRLCDELAKRDSRIKVEHQQNMGLSGARNKGILLAQGEYIGFVDSDDWIDKEFCKRLIDIILKTGHKMASCCYIMVEEDEKKIKKTKKIFVKNMIKDESLEWYLKGIISGKESDCSACTKLYHRSLFLNIKFPEGMLFEDVITNWNIINNIDGYAYCNWVGYYYYERKSSISHASFKEKSMDLILGARMMKGMIEQPEKEIAILLNQYEYKTYFSILIKMLKGTNVEKEKFVEILQIVKKGYNSLMKSPLSIIRKMILSVIVLLPKKVIVFWMDKQNKFKIKK